MIESDWYGLYKERWGDDIVEGAVSHPAKFSRALIRKIYQHAVSEGWLSPGDVVLDPFGGVALGALDAMYHDLFWIGVELEEKFVDLGIANIEMWSEQYGRLYQAGWGSAVHLQGDSRFLTTVLHNAAHGVVSSPPYADTPISPQGGDGADQAWNKAYREYKTTGDHEKFQEQMSKKAAEAGYSGDPGNLGNLKEGDLDAAISSPPFKSQSADGGWQMLDKYAKEGKLTIDQAKGDPSKSFPSWSEDRDTSYGHSEGQLADMPEGEIDFREVEPVEGKDYYHTNTPDPNLDQAFIDAGYVIDGEESIDAAISSPPFMQTSGGKNVTAEEGPLSDPALIKRHSAGNKGAGGYGEQDGQLEQMPEGDIDAAIASPPYAEARIGQDSREEQIGHNVAYGETDGQLGRMKELCPECGRDYCICHVDAAIASPPFGTADTRDRNPVQGGEIEDVMTRAYTQDRQGTSDGNLAAMDMSVSSPPYGDIEQSGSTKGLIEHGTGLTQGKRCFDEYGESEGQLGRMKYEKKDEAETFWDAALTIVQQIYQVLKPGGHAIWVVKAYVKNKEYIDFPGQWQQLCEAVGFETEHYHRAWVIEEKGAQYDIFGELHEKTVERKSFFRRLAEKKGSPRIDYEVVLCMRK